MTSNQPEKKSNQSASKPGHETMSPTSETKSDPRAMQGGLQHRPGGNAGGQSESVRPMNQGGREERKDHRQGNEDDEAGKKRGSQGQGKEYSLQESDDKKKPQANR